MLAASKAKGTTILKNCAIEPEIKDLIIFLRKLGLTINIKGRTITVTHSVKKNSKIVHSVIFDRIELGTYMIASALLAKNKIVNEDIKVLVMKSNHFNK